ncbi:MAG: hypothetical protein GY854_04320 [Deltaproteobacteria bacterium]|nr:hypothetical protein [Deltaproteobacteria bacterium]
MKDQIGYRLPFVLMLVIGIFFCFQYYLPHPRVQAPVEMMRQWKNPLGGFVMMVAALGLIIHHVRLVLRRERRYGYSVVTLTAAAGMTFFGLVFGTGDGTVFADWFQYFLAPIEATMFSLLAFFVASAAFRAFRARTAAAAVLLGSAFVVILGLIPVVEDACPPIADLSAFLLKYPTTASKRAIMIGVALGAISVAIKTIIGVDRTILGRDR